MLIHVSDYDTCLVTSSRKLDYPDALMLDILPHRRLRVKGCLLFVNIFRVSMLSDSIHVSAATFSKSKFQASNLFFDNCIPSAATD